MARVAVTNRAKSFVIATDKSRARADPMSSLHDRAIQLQRKLDHGSRFVDVIAGKKLDTKCPKGLLSRRNNALIFLVEPGHIKQSEEDQVRRDPEKIVEVATHPLSVINRRHLR